MSQANFPSDARWRGGLTVLSTSACIVLDLIAQFRFSSLGCRVPRPIVPGTEADGMLLTPTTAFPDSEDCGDWHES